MHDLRSPPPCCARVFTAPPPTSVVHRCPPSALVLQWTPFLINVHLLNLPLAAVEHLVNPRLLVPRDIWTSIAFSMAYFVVYMCVLDANGLHFYIILSPRTPLFVLSFSALMGAHLAVYWGWNALTAGLASGLELVPS